MFDWLRKKNPRKELQRRYEAAMRQARDLQRRGDIEGFAAKVAEADRIRGRLDELDTLDSRSPAG